MFAILEAEKSMTKVVASWLQVRALLVCRWPPFGWVIREQSWARRFSADSSRHHSIRAGQSWFPWTLSPSLRSHLYYHFGGKGFSMSLGNTHSSGLSNTKSWKSLGRLGASTAWRFLSFSALFWVVWLGPLHLAWACTLDSSWVGDKPLLCKDTGPSEACYRSTSCLILGWILGFFRHVVSWF